MGTAQTIFEEVVRGGTTGSDATGSYVTASDVSHVTGTGPDRKWSCAHAQSVHFVLLL